MAHNSYISALMWVGFFPIGDGAGVSQVSPSAAPSWGENTAAVFGVHGRRSFGHNYPLTYRVLRGFANANYKQKAVLYSAVFRNGVRLCPPPRLGSRRVYAKNNRHHRKRIVFGVFIIICLSAV